jgi:alpha-L-rhamnosidase
MAIRMFFREYYPNMVKYIVQYMVSRSEDNLVVREEEGGWCLGDWCTPHNIDFDSQNPL